MSHITNWKPTPMVTLKQFCENTDGEKPDHIGTLLEKGRIKEHKHFEHELDDVEKRLLATETKNYLDENYNTQ